jgi:phosphohistidine swiveling domain-containing protein
MLEFASPMGFAMQAVNYYCYVAIVPLPLGDESIEDRMSRHQDTMHQVLPQLGDLWENQWLPGMMPGLDAPRARDYSSLSDSELLGTLKSMREEFTDRYTVHGKINFVIVSASMYADLYNELFTPEDPTEPYETLQGFPTRSLAAGRGLWKLSRQIRSSNALSQVFNESDVSEIVPRLEQTDDGRAFLTDFRAYLEEFGWRSDVFEFADPTWREDPTIPLNTLQGYIRLGDDSDPDARHAETVDRKDQLLERARERLAGDPETLGKFNALYDMARPYLELTENHNFYIDQIGNGVMRLPVLEIGSRLAERGTVPRSEDVFMLYIEELGAALGGQDFNSTVAQRRSELEHWAQIIPVPAIGEPPEHSDDPMSAGFEKMFGAPPEPSRDPDVLQGIGASAGGVQGTVKVVKNLSEGSKLRQGDIMVCEMTMPPWTPLFATVSAVVADTGGVLSHCAIVSREYRMPCVVGTQVGTALLQDGMKITVDGSTGIVRIDSRWFTGAGSRVCTFYGARPSSLDKHVTVRTMPLSV